MNNSIHHISRSDNTYNGDDKILQFILSIPHIEKINAMIRETVNKNCEWELKEYNSEPIVVSMPQRPRN